MRKGSFNFYTGKMEIGYKNVKNCKGGCSEALRRFLEEYSAGLAEKIMKKTNITAGLSHYLFDTVRCMRIIWICQFFVQHLCTV